MKPFLALILLVGLAPTSHAQGSDPEGDVVDLALIIINDSILTSSMLDNEAARMLFRQSGMDPQEANSRALTLGVSRILLQEAFKKLGFEEGLLDAQVDLQIDRLILEDGSRASFEKSLRLDGYASIEAFRKDLRSSFLRSTVQGVLGGMIPSPSQGIRTLAQPTPAEIRAAYDAREAYRHVESELQWAQLQFFKDRGKPPPEERAAEVSNRLRAGLMTVEDALKDADKVRRSGGIPQGMLAEFEEFLEFAEPGACKNLPTSASGVAQLMVIIGRTEARDFSFQEAQLIIAKDLTAANRNIAVAGALSDLYRESYVWVNPGVPGLAASLEAAFGGVNSSQEAGEL